MDGMGGVDGWHAGAGHDCPAQQAFFGKGEIGKLESRNSEGGPRTAGPQEGEDNTGLQDYGAGRGGEG